MLGNFRDIDTVLLRQVFFEAVIRHLGVKDLTIIVFLALFEALSPFVFDLLCFDGLLKLHDLDLA